MEPKNYIVGKAFIDKMKELETENTKLKESFGYKITEVSFSRYVSTKSGYYSREEFCTFINNCFVNELKDMRGLFLRNKIRKLMNKYGLKS